MLEQFDLGGNKSSEAQALEVAVEAEGYETSVWWNMARSIAEGVPSETDYIYENWTHEKIALEQIELAKQQLNMESDT